MNEDLKEVRVSLADREEERSRCRAAGQKQPGNLEAQRGGRGWKGRRKREAPVVWRSNGGGRILRSLFKGSGSYLTAVRRWHRVLSRGGLDPMCWGRSADQLGGHCRVWGRGAGQQGRSGLGCLWKRSLTG